METKLICAPHTSNVFAASEHNDHKGNQQNNSAHGKLLSDSGNMRRGYISRAKEIPDRQRDRAILEIGMTIPTYDQFIEPLLRFLGTKPEGVSTSEVYASLAEKVGLTEAERDELLPSRRQPVYQNRIGWAHDRLKRADLSQSLRRGTWQLTDGGRAFLASHSSGVTEEEIEKIAKVPPDSRLRDPDESEPEQEEVAGYTASPDERIDQAISEVNDSVASELLDLIARS